MAVRAANIGPKGRRRRVLMGAATLVAGSVVLVVLLMSGVGRGWRVALWVAFWAGALGILPARAHTGVRLAARGRGDLDRGLGVVAGAGGVAQLQGPDRP